MTLLRLRRTTRAAILELIVVCCIGGGSLLNLLKNCVSIQSTLALLLRGDGCGTVFNSMFAVPHQQEALPNRVSPAAGASFAILSRKFDQ